MAERNIFRRFTRNTGGVVDGLETRMGKIESYISTIPANNSTKESDLLVTGQNYATNFKSCGNPVSDKLGKEKELYRFQYVRGTGSWFDNVYGLGYRMVNHAYAERFVSTYAKYCFQEINANVIDGSKKTTNVLTKDKMINYVQNALLYRKILVRIKMYPNYEKVEKIYYDHELDRDNNPIIHHEGYFFKELYDDDNGSYKWVIIDVKENEIPEKIKKELGRLNENNFDCPFGDYVFEIPFESDVVRKAFGICHKLDKANAKLNWESDVGATMAIVPHGMIKGFKDGTSLYRTMLPTGGENSKTEDNKPLFIKSSGGMDEVIKEINHLKDELSETTHINFLSEISTEQTATEFKGREKPFIQSINEINNIFFPIIKKIYNDISSFYRIFVDELELPEFELHTETQTQLIANGISQISAFPDPIVQAQVVGMFLNYSAKEVESLAQRLKDQDEMIGSFNSGMNLENE